jgi:uroporphyrinogen-III synthase
MAKPLTVLITRPQPQAQEWVAALAADTALRQSGAVLQALPLLAIGGAAEGAPVSAAWARLTARTGATADELDPAAAMPPPGWDALVFVSPSAVEQFFAAAQPGARWPQACWAAAPGPGTLAVLARCGVPEPALLGPGPGAEQFDSEALWQTLALHDWRGRRVLIVRSEGGREWLAEQLTQAGAHVDYLSAYRRIAPVWTAAERALCEEALRRPAHHLWCFSSSEAIDYLVSSHPHSGWSDAQALVTHPRIAQRAQAAGFGCVRACQPTPQAVSACIRACIQSAAT